MRNSIERLVCVFDEMCDEPPPLEEEETSDVIAVEDAETDSTTNIDDAKADADNQGEEGILLEEMMRAARIAEKKKEAKRKSRRKREDKSFGSGMRKGFFNRKQKKKTKKKTMHGDVKKETIPTLRPARDASSSIRFKEVQETLSKGKWVNNDLIEKIKQNPTLLRTFSDPRFSHLAQKLQSDPKAVIEEARRNPVLKDFLNNLTKVLGEHFTQMGTEAEEKMPTQTSIQPQPDPEVKKVLDNPELRAILMDPKMKAVLQECSSKPGALPYYMSHPEFGVKLRKMAAAGLIQIQ